MSNRITGKKQYSGKVFALEVEAPPVARARRAGHFVIVRTHPGAERIPLTIADADPRRGTITLVAQAVGAGTARLCAMRPGESLADVAGPLGRATRIENFGTVLCASGGVGTAPMLPIARALRAAGNRVLGVIAGRTAELVILEDEMRQACHELTVMTDDGSRGRRGLVTAGMEEIIQSQRVDKCFAIGPAVMMKFCCQLTARHAIPTDVSLNTIMVDGTGMCGACRVSVGGRTRFVCVDGPEFDGHQVDFDEMLRRAAAFRPQEQEAMQAYLAAPHAAPEPHGGPAHAGAPPEPGPGGAQAAPGAHTAPPPDGQPAGAALLTDRAQPWRERLRQAMKPRERMRIPRCEMPELPPALRATRLDAEVQTGLSPEQARQEARRCLDCPKPACRQGCPVGIDIPAFIKNLERGDAPAAARVLKLTSLLPAICGRVCPQEKQCEALCIHRKAGGRPVAIGYLERFAADHETPPGQPAPAPRPAPPTGKSVAVVGSGPAGLSFAGDMARRGHRVVVMEALHELGGVLRYGIPEFRLPNSIVDREIDSLRRMGVSFRTDCVVGKTITADELLARGFHGIFVASGAGLPRFQGIPGENSNGVVSSNEYLTRVNLMGAGRPGAATPLPRGSRVMVVGGGNTAMDSCRTARRLGAERVFVAYRRGEEEMPARLEEVRHAKEEGVEFLTLHNPVEYLCDERGNLRAAVLQRMALGEPDQSGRRSPVPVPGDTVTVPVDLAIVAVGVSPNPIAPASIPGLALGKRGTIEADEEMRTSRPEIMAGGDIVRGGATVILAMGDGRRAAQTMHERLAAGGPAQKETHTT